MSSVFSRVEIREDQRPETDVKEESQDKGSRWVEARILGRTVCFVENGESEESILSKWDLEPFVQEVSGRDSVSTISPDLYCKLMLV